MPIDTLPDLRELQALAADEPVVLRPPEPSDRTTSAGRALVVIAICLGLWALLFAPVLKRNAEAGPVGARRSAALDVLRPLAALADTLSVSRATDAFERALGRDPAEAPGGELDLPALGVGPLPSEAAAPHVGPARPGGGSSHRRHPGAGATGASSGHASAASAPAASDVALRVPETNDKLRVAVVGDSLAEGLGPAVAESLNANLVRVLPLGRQSTGLARLDYFNWQGAMRQLEEQFRPDLVFVMLGSNDAQAQIGPDGNEILVGSVQWVSAYEDRASRFLREATSEGTRVVWVGVPVVRDRQRWGFYRRVNSIYREAASDDPLATYVDAWGMFETKTGGYTAYLRNERGDLQEMRAPDGLHFTPSGYAYLAREAIRAAAETFDLQQRAIRFRI